VTAPVQVWRYHLPNDRETREGWAIAFLDSIGCFTVLSDYGDYGYRWPEADRRRMGSWTRERARDEWNILNDADIDTREGFALWYQETKIEDAYELAEYGEYGVPKRALAFCQHVMPRLRAVIRADLGKAAA